MIALLRYNAIIALSTMFWTGILVLLLVGLVLFGQFRNRDEFGWVEAASLAEQFIPVLAAFLAAGVLEAELKRGAHELLRSKRIPLWRTLGYRLAVALALAMLIGAGMLLVLHLGIRRLPLGMLLLAALPPSACLAAVSLWTRVRLGNAFIGFVVALAAWIANVLTGLMGGALGISLNPLLTFSSYTDRLQAAAAGALDTTPYVDWWWASKAALLLVSAWVFCGIARRVEHLVEGD